MRLATALNPTFLDGALLRLISPAIVFVRNANADRLYLISEHERHCSCDNDRKPTQLYEVYASSEAFVPHGPSKQQAERDFKGLKVSATDARCEVVE